MKLPRFSRTAPRNRHTSQTSNARKRRLLLETLDARMLLAADVDGSDTLPLQVGSLNTSNQILIGNQEQERNDTRATANELPRFTDQTTFSGQLVQGVIERFRGLPIQTDPDFFQFSLEQSENLLWEATSSSASFEFDVLLLDEAGRRLNRATIERPVAGETSFVTQFSESLPAGDYFISVDAGPVRVASSPRVSEYQIRLVKGALGPSAIGEIESNDSFDEAQFVGEPGAIEITGTVSFERVRVNGLNTNKVDADFHRFRMRQDGDLEITLRNPDSVGDSSSAAVTVFDQDERELTEILLTDIQSERTVTLAGLGQGEYYLQTRFESQSRSPFIVQGSHDYTIFLDGPEPEKPIGSREQEPNDNANDANYLGELGSTISVRGRLDVMVGDELTGERIPESDWYRFDVTQKGNFRIESAVDFVQQSPLVRLRAEDLSIIQPFSFDGLPQVVDTIELVEGTYYLEFAGEVNNAASNVGPRYHVSVSRIAVPGRGVINGREIESNDSFGTANQLGDLESTLTVGGVIGLEDADGNRRVGANSQFANADYFAFSLDTETTSNVTAVLSVDELPFPLDIALFRYDDASESVQAITQFPLQGILSNRRTVELESGNYFVAITAPPVPLGINREPAYSLILSRQDVEPIEPDRFDMPVRNDARTTATVVDLATSYARLSIHEPSDRDVFTLTLDQTGQPSDRLAIRFDGREADLDLRLSDSEGRTVDVSDSTSSREQISLAGIDAGTYFVEVFGVGDAVATYDLTFEIDPPVSEGASIAADAYESNDTLNNAHDFAAVEGRLIVDDLSIHVDDGNANADFFQFYLTDTGGPTHFVEVATNPAGQPRTLRLRDASGSVVDTDQRRLSLEGRDAGPYTIEVTSNTTTGFQYSLDFRTPVRSSEFTVQFDLDDSVTDTRVLSALQSAKARLEAVVIGDVPDVNIPAGVYAELPDGLYIDDILVLVQVKDFPANNSNVLAHAKGIPRENDGLPYLGYVGINRAQINNMVADGNLDDVLLHELIHALTAPSELWPAMGLLSSTSPEFIGTNAVREYSTLLGETANGVLLETRGGAGTAGSHWDKPTFVDELMVGSAAPNLLFSRLTIGMLNDMGYAVNYDAADAYTLPSKRQSNLESTSSLESSDSLESQSSRLTDGAPLDADDLPLPDLFGELEINAPPTIAPSLASLFVDDGIADSLLTKSQQGPEVRTIRAGEIRSFPIQLDGRGTAENHFSVESIIDRPLEVVLKDSLGNVLSRGLSEDRQYVSLAGYPAGNYSIEVSSAENNRFLPPVALDVDAFEPQLAAVDIDGNGQFNAIADYTLAVIANLNGIPDEQLEATAAPGASNSAGELRQLVSRLRDSLDIDGDGSVNSIADGTLAALSSLTGIPDAQIEARRAPNATRSVAEIRERSLQLLSKIDVADSSRIALTPEGEATMPAQRLELIPNGNAVVGEKFEVAIRYSTLNVNGDPEPTTASAIGFRIYFSSQDLSYLPDESDLLEQFGLTTGGLEFVGNDEGNDDNDPNTDRVLTFGYQNAPGLAANSLPTEFVRLSFDVNASSRINVQPVVSLSDPQFRQLGSSLQLGSVQTQVRMTVDPRSVNENGNGTLDYMFTRSGDLSSELRVNYQLSGGSTANAPDDFNTLPGFILIPAGQESATLSIDPRDDSILEPDETIILTLVDSDEYTLGTPDSATGTIINDDSIVSIAADSADKPEGSSGTTPFTFTVTRTGSTAGVSSVNYAVSGDTDAVDFASGTNTGLVQFAIGEASQTVTVLVTGDTIDEEDESFTIMLSSATGATIGTGSANGTIINDDTPAVTPVLSIIANSANKPEGSSGTTPFTFIVTRTGSTAGVSSVNYAVSGDTDVADFASGSNVGTVSFAAGEDSKTVTVLVNGDSIEEGNENFTVALNNASGATIGTGSAAGTILDDDTPAPTSVLSVAAVDASQREGDNGPTGFTFEVTRGGLTTGTTMVTLTASGSGPNPADGEDFVGGVFPSMILSFAPGETSKLVTLEVMGDSVREVNERFVVTLSSPSDNASISSGSATATIVDDDRATTQTRILVPSRVARLHVIPGDSIPTAIIFQATRTTVLSLVSLGETSGTELVRILNGNLQPISTLQGRTTVATVNAGSLNAILFEPQATERIYSIRSSEGFDALGGNGGTNLFQPTDTSGDGATTALDALMVINRLNADEGEGESTLDSTALLDVNGDGSVTAVDALSIINYLNRGEQLVFGEGESLSLAPDLPQAIFSSGSVNHDNQRGSNDLLSPKKIVGRDADASIPQRELVDMVFADDRKWSQSEEEQVQAILGTIDLLS